MRENINYCATMARRYVRTKVNAKAKILVEIP